MGRLEGVFGLLGPSWGPLGALMGPSWGHLEVILEYRRSSDAHLGRDLDADADGDVDAAKGEDNGDDRCLLVVLRITSHS